MSEKSHLPSILRRVPARNVSDAINQGWAPTRPSPQRRVSAVPQDFFNWHGSAWGPAHRRGHLGLLASYSPKRHPALTWAYVGQR